MVLSQYPCSIILFSWVCWVSIIFPSINILHGSLTQPSSNAVPCHITTIPSIHKCLCGFVLYHQLSQPYLFIIHTLCGFAVSINSLIKSCLYWLFLYENPSCFSVQHLLPQSWLVESYHKCINWAGTLYSTCIWIPAQID